MLLAAPQLNENEGIAGDRREGRRYSIQMDLRWRLIRRRKLLSSGSGSTVDLSSAGILFDAGRPLPAGLDVELSIAWPVLLNDKSPMQLVVTGRIIRCNANHVAFRMVQHEFRTVAAPHDLRRGLAAVIRPTAVPFAGKAPRVLETQPIDRGL